jgi:hypothetical protein
MACSWGLGVEHEFLIEVNGKVVPSSSVFPYPKSTNPETLASVKIPLDATPDTIKSMAPSTRSTAGRRHHNATLALLQQSRCVANEDLIAIVYMSSLDDDSAVRRVRGKIGTLDTAFSIDVWAGDTLIIIHTSSIMHPVVVPSGQRRRRLTPIEVWDALATAVALISPARVAALEWPTELDGDFIEVRSSKPIRATVRGVVTQMRDEEATVLKKAKKAYPHAKNVRVFPWSGYVERGTARYAGSYHFWITMPMDVRIVAGRHATDATDAIQQRRTALRRHAALAHMLQWMEPLFLCTYTGDPRALPGNGYRHASMRAAINEWSGYGTTPAYRMLMDSKTANEHVWYSSDADLLASRSPNMLRDLSWPLLVLSGGKLVPFENCIDMDRLAAYNTDGPESFGMLYHAQRDFDGFFAEKDDADGKQPAHGADVRTKLCSSMRIPLKNGWRMGWVFVSSREYGKSLQMRFVNMSRRLVVREIPVDTDEWRSVLTRKATGIEFRAIDNFPSEGIEGFARTIVLLAAAAAAWDEREESKDMLETLRRHASALSPSWKAAMHAVERGGSHAALPQAYVAELISHLSLPETTARKSNINDAYGTLCAVVDALHTRYARHTVAMQLDPENARAGPPVIINYNHQHATLQIHT